MKESLIDERRVMKYDVSHEIQGLNPLEVKPKKKTLTSFRSILVMDLLGIERHQISQGTILFFECKT